jgi:hypothetical protein
LGQIVIYMPQRSFDITLAGLVFDPSQFSVQV